MGDVSSTRLYLGNLHRSATKEEVEQHFNSSSGGRIGEITEIKVMNGFGFIEYKDPLDAKDVVPHGSEFKDLRLTVQFARGLRHKENGQHDRQAPPRPRRTIYRLQINGIPSDTSWQDLKDFARQSGRNVVYAEMSVEKDGKGFAEFESAKDLETAVDKLDNHEFKDVTVHCKADIQEERPQRDTGYRSRTPPHRYELSAMDDPYGRRGPPPRGYPPGPYMRERSPGRGQYDDYGLSYRRRSPPPPRNRMDERFGPPPRRTIYEHPPYERRGPPPYEGYPDPYRGGDPYMRRPNSPRYGGGYGGYDEGGYPRHYW